MTGLVVHATQDVREDILQSFATSLTPAVPIRVDSSRAHFRSVTAPSWVKILETPEFWITTFIASIAWDGLKSVFTNRRAIAAHVRATSRKTLKGFVAALSDLAAKLGEGTDLLLGCPVPDDWFSTVMLLRRSPPEAMEEDIAMFLMHLPGIENFLAVHADNLTGQVTLTPCEDGTMSVSWMDRATLTPQQIRLSLADVA